MKVIKREEVWIHTHFIVDARDIEPKEKRRIKLEMEGFLRGLGIVFGIHFKEGERLRVVLECIPERENMSRIEEKLKALLEPIRPKPKVKKIRIEGEDDGRGEGTGPGHK